MGVTFTWKQKAKKMLEEAPDKIIYAMGRITLDMTLPTIPMDTGNMRKATMAFGVQKATKYYRIASPVPYAKAVYNLNDSTTNWTTSGTGNKWFAKTWKSKQAIILKQAVKAGGIK